MNSNGGFSLLIFALPLLLLGWLFYTQNKRMKQMRDFSSSLNVGDRIVTSSGIYGTVQHLDDASAWLEIAEGTTIRVDRRAIAMKQTESASESSPGSTPGTSPSASTDATRSSDASPDEGPGSTPGSHQNGQ